MSEWFRLRGGCHCRALRLVFTTRTPKALQVRACDCSFCRKHGALSVTDPAGSARVVVRSADALHRYRFGLGVTDFLLCRACGVYLAAWMGEGERAWLTLNANVLDERGALSQDVASVSWEGETAEGRVARRKEKWTPASEVSIAEEGADGDDAKALLAAYFEELRTHMPDFDPARSVSASAEEMAAPRGAFVVVRSRGAAIGCGGVKTQAQGVGEIKRMYLAPDARGRGLGADLLEALEDRARALGMRRLVLDTSKDLLPAERLYRSAGYDEVEAYNDNPFATRWFGKVLR